MKHSEIVSKMTLEQKAKFVSGYDYWHLCKDESLGLPEIMVTDGPNGLRKKDPNGNTVGLGGSYPSTCFPGASTVASSWDRELIKKEGYDISKNYKDCGCMIYDINEQDVHSGGSGCGCIASVFCGHIMNEIRAKRLKKILVMGTGALLSTTSSLQGESVPGIAHGVVISAE